MPVDLRVRWPKSKAISFSAKRVHTLRVAIKLLKLRVKEFDFLEVIRCVSLVLLGLHTCVIWACAVLALSLSLSLSSGFFGRTFSLCFFFRRLGSKDYAFRPAPLFERTHAKTRGVGVDYLCFFRRYFSFCFCLSYLLSTPVSFKPVQCLPSLSLSSRFFSSIFFFLFLLILFTLHTCVI